MATKDEADQFFAGLVSETAEVAFRRSFLSNLTIGLAIVTTTGRAGFAAQDGNWQLVYTCLVAMAALGLLGALADSQRKLGSARRHYETLTRREA